MSGRFTSARATLALIVALGCSPAAVEGGPWSADSTLSGDLAQVTPGTRIRISGLSPFPARQVGTFQLLRGDSLHFLTTLDHSGDASIPLSRVAGVEKSAGRRSHFWIGAVVGLVIGAVGTAVFLVATEGESTEEGLVPFVGGIGGAIGGFIVGGVAGSLIRSEDWQPL